MKIVTKRERPTSIAVVIVGRAITIERAIKKSKELKK